MDRQRTCRVSGNRPTMQNLRGNRRRFRTASISLRRSFSASLATLLCGSARNCFNAPCRTRPRLPRKLGGPPQPRSACGRRSGAPKIREVPTDHSRGLKASCRGFNIIGGAKFVCKLINGNRPRIAERYHRLSPAGMAAANSAAPRRSRQNSHNWEFCVAPDVFASNARRKPQSY